MADELLRRAAAHVVVADLHAPEPDDDDRHHLVRVLRLRPGEPVTVTDGAGSWRPCEFGDPGATGPLLRPTGPVVAEPAPAAELAVGFAPVKGDRPEWVVQKLTELGVDRIVVLRAGRSVVRWDGERGVRHLERLERVARGAISQCRRVRLPRIEVASPAELLAGGAVLAEPGGRDLNAADRCVLVGPEGGWTPEELAAAGADQLVTLGGAVLRAETAAVAAGVRLGALHGR
ncbi:MAG: RsmE family RNA methyltransferase [Microthrixaceae bacterium]